MNESYDWRMELGRQALRDRKRMENKRKLTGKQAYNNNAYGSAECVSVRWDTIVAAYDEYKQNDRW